MSYMNQKNWIVKEKCRLDEFLRNELLLVFSSKDVSNSKIRRLIISGAVFVNAKQCRVPSYILFNGSKVCAEIKEDKFFFEKQPDDIDFTLTEENVLFEDESLIIVNKPAFLPTEGTIVENRKSMHSCVIDYLWKKNPSLRNAPYVGIMHRLDRETSGVLLFTKTRQVNKAVFQMFQDRIAKKTYRAVTTVLPNHINKKHFFVENYIGRISAKSAKCKIGIIPENKGGQASKTEFCLVCKKNEKYYFDCFLYTGRTHQIRVHLSSVGYPLLGDTLYGGSDSKRIMLHATSLEFPHPITGKILKVQSPLIEGFF